MVGTNFFILCLLLPGTILSDDVLEELTTQLATTEVIVREPDNNYHPWFPRDRKSSPISTRIIGGSVATEHEYPFQAAIYIYVGNTLYFCGGSLLTTEYVLTAAHCVDYANSIIVVLGAHNLNNQEDSRRAYNSTTYVIHENWDSKSIQNDIALIKLPENVVLDDYIKTVTITPESSETFSGSTGRCLGWGKTALGSLSDVLRYVDAPLISNDECKTVDEYASYIVDHHLCASGDTTVGSCNGDSGGPLLVDGVQVGIVSFGAEDCTAGLPSVYTRLTSFNGWITDAIGELESVTEPGSEIRNEDVDDSAQKFNHVTMLICIVLLFNCLVK